ncbi:mitotic spindle checkpoint protein BUBR1-like [Canna indica]|uniref:Mitotic spindle checkpoint protein BUBR1-like n=1 Tax=Canna indica TaxID=4628 RepID=A0AAQ3Q552_9LILI|nr:mitotic spindle checkpoint protein BUBR1-like [Canna indica]
MEAAASLGVDVAELEAALMAADPETAFLLQQRLRRQDDEQSGGAATDGYEWELYKENVRPLKRGRNVKLLNQSLRSQSNPNLKASLLRTRRRMIEAIDEYQGEDPLHPWLECIKWVQESFPNGGESSGLVVMYEQCVRTFWHDERYKEDLRYLKVWMEYADNCADAEVIFNFLEANEIGQTHSIFYISYGKHLTTKNKFKKADEIFNLGLARKARPLEKLEAAYRAFLVHSTQKEHGNEEDMSDDTLSVRSFGTVLTSVQSRRQPAENPVLPKRKVALQRVDTNKPLSIYKDENSKANDHPLNLKRNEKSWNTLGSRVDRNKENAPVPEKWSSYKVPQKIVHRIGSATPSACINVYVDEECAEQPPAQPAKSSTLKLRKANSQNLKKEAEMLRDNPLRNFPLNSLR